MSIDKQQENWAMVEERFPFTWNTFWIEDYNDPFFGEHFDFKYIPAFFVIRPDGKMKKCKDFDALRKYLDKKVGEVAWPQDAE